ncbi:MAG: Gfo/Idh/MocA family oxidoreductase [Planctomycetota bacterium]
MGGGIRVVLVGLGGYGEVYLGALLDRPRRKHVRLAAAVDPAPDRCRRQGEVRARGIPIFPDLAQVPEGGERCLTVVSSPIHFHAEHTLLALARGSHVLCEKPAAATVGEVERMTAAGAAAGRFVAVGFQWSFSASIRALKRDLAAGVFGRPRRARSLTLWPRPDAYYARNDWAGRRRDTAGRWILDSPASNAMAHDLHNLLFLLGEAEDATARPVEVEAETYRAYDVETFDTVAARVRTAGDVEILFLASHVTAATRDPAFVLECEEAVVRFPGGLAPMVAAVAGTTVREYPSPEGVEQTEKLWVCADAVDGGPLPCTAATARAHVQVVEAIDGARETRGFPAARRRRGNDSLGPRTWIEALDDELGACFTAGRLPSEQGLPWAAPAGRAILARRA